MIKKEKIKTFLCFNRKYCQSKKTKFLFGSPSLIEALNRLWLSTTGLVLKHTVTVWSIVNMCVEGGASLAARLLPQNLDLPLIGGEMVTQSPNASGGVWTFE